MRSCRYYGPPLLATADGGRSKAELLILENNKAYAKQGIAVELFLQVGRPGCVVACLACQCQKPRCCARG